MTKPVPAAIGAFILLAACGEVGPATMRVDADPVPGGWVIDREKSYIEFSGTQTGKSFSGRFQSFDAAIILNPADPSAARIEAVIDTGSAKTGDRQRDAALPGAEWFASKTHPEARFISNAVRATGAGAYVAPGVLSVRGIERPLALPFTLAVDGDRAVADASFTLNRTDFGIGQGEEFATDKWVGYEVKMTLHIEAVR